MSNSQLNKLLLSAPLSARLQATDLRVFVPVPGLAPQVASGESQIIFGRHGTGKTHLLVDLQRAMAADGLLTASIDLRSAGAASDLYGDWASTDLPMKATRLAVDVLEAIHNAVREQLADRQEMDADAANSLDQLGDAITRLRVSGTQEQSEAIEKEHGRSRSRRLWAGLTVRSPAAGVDGSSSQMNREKTATVIVQQGHADVWLHLGSVTDAFSSLTGTGRDLLVLLDEWNSVPLQLQPYLADLLRRLLWGTSGCILKIAAVQGESRFLTSLEAGLVGMNLHDVNTVALDSYLLPAGESTRAFIEGLLFENAMGTVVGVERQSKLPADARTFCSAAFSSEAMNLLIEASEGNPRDALIVARNAARVAGASLIVVDHVARASYELLYEHKDGSAINPAIGNWLGEKVLGPGKSRCFYVDRGSGEMPRALRPMYEARLLHRGSASRKSEAKSDWGQLFSEWHVDYAYALHLLGGADRTLDPNRIPPVLAYETNKPAPLFRREDWHNTSTFAALDAGSTPTVAGDGTPSSWVNAEVESLPDSGTFLVIDSGERVWSVPLDRSPLVLGRGDCDIKIDHPTVSRQHATLSRNGDSWRIVDRSSTNGVVVHGARREWHELVPNDMVWLGFIRLYFVQRESDTELGGEA